MVNQINQGSNSQANVRLENTKQQATDSAKQVQVNTATAKATSDSVSITPQAQQLKKLNEKAEQSSGIDHKKVNELKKAIANGEYKIDAEKRQKEMHQDRLQRLVLKGEWLEKYETQLKVIQSTVLTAMGVWYEDDSETCNETAIYQMNDALSLLTDIVRDLRYECFCPDEQRKNVLYYHGFKGAVTEVVNFNKDQE